VIAKLDAVSSQLEDVTKERAREIAVLQADLESEKEARRGWQDRAGTFREQLLGMVISSGSKRCSTADISRVGTSAVCARVD